MRRLLVCTIAPIAMAAFAVPALGRTTTIKVGDNYYVRDRGVPTVTVKRNDIVRWTFVGRSAHTVTVKSGPVKFTSKARTSGTVSKRLTRKGLYKIYCEIHGERDQSMNLKVG